MVKSVGEYFIWRLRMQSSINVLCDRAVVAADNKTIDAYWFGEEGEFITVSEGAAMYVNRKRNICAAMGNGGRLSTFGDEHESKETN